MITYDANRQPDALGWLAASEDDRIEAVRRYHRHLDEPHPKIPEPELHWTLHVTVENQFAMGADMPVQSTVERLMADGLSRHDALHAVGFVLAGHLVRLVEGRDPGAAMVEYCRRLLTLTPESWRREAAAESAQHRRFRKRQRRSR
ncbi:MAG: hypothetical protein KDA22_02500 [Phycisphaerales bacterium]|nr:hypothetical protein [Phycisphaerales bacterium]